VSADGRFVAFSSGASNLHPDDTDGGLAGEDVFVRDLQLNTTTLVSRAAGATGDKGNNQSFTPAVSADGRFVAFSSIASNLHPDDGDAVLDVFRRDVLGPRPAQPPSGQPPSGQPPSGQRPVGPAAPAQPGCPLVGNVVVGTPADDVRGGGALSDIIFGRGGADLLRGLGGADCLYGQRGADRLLGGRGRDRLFGGPGADRLVGGAGNDQLRDHPGRDRLLGGRGRDRLNPGRGRDRVAAGPGNDRVLARDSAADTIDCGPGRRDLALIDRLDDTRRCERVRVP
jgi:Ca2+-binding RTX toxin-like protein